jgi:hypothetical protein
VISGRLSGIGKPVILDDTIPLLPWRSKKGAKPDRQKAINGDNRLAAIYRFLSLAEEGVLPPVVAFCRWWFTAQLQRHGKRGDLPSDIFP